MAAMCDINSTQTAATLSFFLLAMVLHPEVMQRAQEEIDTVIGRDRLPSFTDTIDLPYVSAIVKEVLRWRPVAPSSFDLHLAHIRC